MSFLEFSPRFSYDVINNACRVLLMFVWYSYRVNVARLCTSHNSVNVVFCLFCYGRWNNNSDYNYSHDDDSDATDYSLLRRSSTPRHHVSLNNACYLAVISLNNVIIWVWQKITILGIATHCYALCTIPVVTRYCITIFTARCTLVHSAVLRSHVVCLSICLSVCDVGELWSHRLEFFENNFIIS